MTSGRIFFCDSYPSPQRSSTPGEKPSATTSHLASRALAIARPRGSATFSDRPRLPGFLLLNWPPTDGSFRAGSGAEARARASRPPSGTSEPRPESGWVFHSTFSTSAPSAARYLVAPAEARNQLKSRIRTPARGNGLPSADRSPPGSENEYSERVRPAPVPDPALEPVPGQPSSSSLSSSPGSGARRPACHEPRVEIHLLTGKRNDRSS